MNKTSFWLFLCIALSVIISLGYIIGLTLALIYGLLCFFTGWVIGIQYSIWLFEGKKEKETNKAQYYIPKTWKS